METKYIQELSHYETIIPRDDMWRWEEMLRNNTTLDSSITGFLLGKARPVFADVKCQICNEKILEGEEFDYEKHGDHSWMPPRYKYMHLACYQKEKEKSNSQMSQV